MKTTRIIAMGLAVILLTCSAVMADPFNLNRPITLGTPSVSSELTLQEIFDAALSNGSLDAVADQSTAALWNMSRDGNVDAYLVSMFRGDDGTLGVYSASTGAMYDFTFDNTNQAGFVINNKGHMYAGNKLMDTNFGFTFGFYWKNTTVGTMSFTEDSKNVDNTALALSYQLKTGTEVDTMAYGGTTYRATGDDWILAFEDRIMGDFDFNDAVFLIEDIVPTPEPATIVLLGAGLIGLVGFCRRKKASC